MHHWTRFLMMLLGVIFASSFSDASPKNLPVSANAILFLETKNIGVSSIGQVAPHDEWIVWPEIKNSDITPQIASLRFSNSDLFKKINVSIRNRDANSYKVGSVHIPLLTEQTDCRVLKLDASRPLAPELVLLAVDPFTMTSSFDSVEKLRPEILYVGEVRSWDEVEKVHQSLSGRILILEKPSFRGERWTRMWRKGSGWPSGLATDGDISGMVHSASVIQMVERAPISMFPLIRSLPAKPNEVLEIGRLSHFLQISIILFLTFSAFILKLLISEEKHRLIDYGWIVPVLSLICSGISLGSFIANFGATGWIIAWIVMFFGLTMIGLVLLQVAPKARELPLLKFLILCFALTGFCNGHFSPLSPTVAIENRVFTLQLAFLLITMISSIRGSRYLDGWLWLTPRLLALGFILHGALGNPAWCQCGKDAVLCVLGFWLYAEGLSGWPIVLSLVFSPFQIDRTLNSASFPPIPAFEGILLMIYLATVLGSMGINRKFFIHQMKKSEVNFFRSGTFILGLLFIPPLWPAMLPALLLNQIMNRFQAIEALQKLD